MIRTAVAMTFLALLLVGCSDTGNDDREPGEHTVPTPGPTEQESPEPDPTPTVTPELDDEMPDSDWFELFETEKVYPASLTGEEVLELAENQTEFDELWQAFGFEDPASSLEINWDTTMVLFVGTGESGTCPTELDTVEYDENERLISVGTSRNVPDDTMCTMDWTPRAFVIALDRDIPGEGELRALVVDVDYEDQLDPERAKIIREEE
jgi:hypothetical protein